MKESKLLVDAKIDIKIQRGLKIVQFGTQYNLHKAYYRSCPLNDFDQQEQNISSKASNAQAIKSKEDFDLAAQIMCELNEQLLNMSGQDEQSQESEPQIIKSNTKVLVLNQPVVAHPQKSISISKSSLKGSDSDSHVSLEQLSNYDSQRSKSKLVPIIEEKQPSQQKSLIQLQNQVNSIISNKSKKPKIQIVDQPKIHNQTITLKQETKLKQISKSSFSQKSDKIKKIQVQQQQSPHHSSHNLLNNNISKIASNDSLMFGKDSFGSSIGQAEVLRQLSETFVDDQNMKMLVKIQDCELKQRYLQERIIKRLQKGYKSVNRIFDISWESLKLPKMQYSFKRPNYAHTIE